MTVFYDPEMAPDGSNPTACSSAQHATAGRGNASVMRDGSPLCAYEAGNTHGVYPFQSHKTDPALLDGVVFDVTPGDLASFNGPSLLADLQVNDFSNSLTYEFMAEMSGPGGTLWLSSIQQGRDLRGAGGAQLVSSVFESEFARRIGATPDTTLIYWREFV